MEKRPGDESEDRIYWAVGKQVVGIIGIEKSHNVCNGVEWR